MISTLINSTLKGGLLVGTIVVALVLLRAPMFFGLTVITRTAMSVVIVYTLAGLLFGLVRGILEIRKAKKEKDNVEIAVSSSNGGKTSKKGEDD